MITPTSQVLRPLLARYAQARVAVEQQPDAAALRALEDVSYTLCVLTGTARVEDALAAADQILERHTGPAAGKDSSALAA
ncbi:DUF5133 domain-containing protein [Streptomyces sp. NPDC087440]|uniref:DUF5133 domain-containing protein n=1 Tax=Streptomyces sp. NPDC087440 TaxID=3365790 RepID=UPI0038257976